VQEPASPTPDNTRSGRQAARRRAQTGLGLLIAGPLIGLLLVGALSLATMNEVSVGGPQDNRVTQAHALVADTTVPSQNLAALEGTLLLLTDDPPPSDAASLRAQVEQTESRYREGHAYWDTHLSDPVLRDSLLVEAHEPVATLFRLVHERLWPTLDRGDQVLAASIVRDQLVPLLQRHENAMGHVSTQADEELQATAHRASEAITLRTRLFGAVLAAVMSLVALAAFAAMRLTRREGDELGGPVEVDAANSSSTETSEVHEDEAEDEVADVDEVHDPHVTPTLDAALGSDLESEIESAIELTH